MVLYYARGSETDIITESELEDALKEVYRLLGDRSKVAIIPPDFTRLHSKAGEITQMIFNHYKSDVVDIMPALGTHAPMTEEQLVTMFGSIPLELFRIHDWRNDVVTMGEVPAEMVVEASDGHLNQPWPAQINKLFWEGDHDLIFSVGQVVPHEVMGMANYNKNVLIGVGGADAINLSHFIGAVYGMERMMGVANNPLRKVLNYASEHFLNRLPLVYIQTVVGRDEATKSLVLRGVFVGDDVECFEKAAELSLKVNFTLLEEPVNKIVAYLNPAEFHSTWLGNKAVYRTRMAIADDGELVILAPGVCRFGEDDRIDLLIRQFGYRTTPEIMQFLKDNVDLTRNLGAAAHLIHGSSEGRFRITYCPGHLTREEVEGVGYGYADIREMSERYNIAELREGYNTMPDGERIYFISNPALGLWAYRGRFESSRK